jgi:hypothetical protein
VASIPTFPQFRLLEIGDRPVLEAITRRFPPYSDFSFTSLWCWVEQCAISLLNGNLVVRMTDYATAEPFYSFLGNEEIAETALALLALARADGLQPHLRLIPRTVVTSDTRLPNLLSITPDRDNFDYLYAAGDWDRFAGTAFATHRQMITRCRRGTALDVRPFDLWDDGMQSRMLCLFDDWVRQKSSEDDIDHGPEQVALERLFALAGYNRLWACGAFDGDRLVGFSISEGLPGSDCVVSHFRKTDRNYPGLSSWLCQEESRQLLARSYRHINFEQDLGIAGLRRHKLSLRPRQFLEKFVVSASPSAETHDA